MCCVHEKQHLSTVQIQPPVDRSTIRKNCNVSENFVPIRLHVSDASGRTVGPYLVFLADSANVAARHGMRSVFEHECGVPLTNMD